MAAQCNLRSCWAPSCLGSGFCLTGGEPWPIRVVAGVMLSVIFLTAHVGSAPGPGRARVGCSLKDLHGLPGGLRLERGQGHRRSRHRTCRAATRTRLRQVRSGPGPGLGPDRGYIPIDWPAYPFLLEHAIKSTCRGGLAPVGLSSEHRFVAAGRGPAAFFTAKNVLGAYSPAEFWRRWNRPMYRWLLENIYTPLGGRRHPSLGHACHRSPYPACFTSICSRVTLPGFTGYPTAFFLLQGLAAMLTRRFKPAGWLAGPAILVTFAFNTLSTVLLFIPINERVPFYVNAVPQVAPSVVKAWGWKGIPPGITEPTDPPDLRGLPYAGLTAMVLISPLASHVVAFLPRWTCSPMVER